MNQRKAISPIIAIIIILLITIAIAGAGYSYLSTYWGSLVGKEIQVTSTFCTGGNQGRIMVRNIGTNPVETGEITVINPLTGEDITQGVLWSSSAGDPEAMLELRFDDQNNPGLDTSGQGNHGTLVGDAHWVEGGRLGGAVDLDGDGDWVDCGCSVQNIPGAITIAFWIKADDNGLVVSSGTQYGVFIERSGDSDRVRYWYWGASTGGWINYATDYIADLIPPNTWTHVAVVNTPGNVPGWTVPKMYVNGIERTVTGPTQENNAGGGACVYIGEYTGYQPYNPTDGIIDEVRVFNRILSEDEIKSLASSFTLQPGETMTLNTICSGRCRYNLVLGWGAKEAMLEC